MNGVDSLKKYERSLEEANLMMEKIAEQYENISPIIPADYELFERFFQAEEKHTYGNSWIYITQGTFGIGPEKLGYKYYDGENLCVLSMFPKIEQPDMLMMYWVRPMGKDILSIIIKLSEEIKRKYHIYSYVKKLFPEQYKVLLDNGFRSATEFPWHSSTHSEDDTYPELIFDREKSRKAIFESSKRSRLGRILREVSKLQRENRIEVINTNFEEKAWNIVGSYFDKYGEFATKKNISSPFDYHNMVFLDHSNSVKNIVLVNGKPLGFYVLARDDKNNTSHLYGCITLRQYYKYLSDYCFIRMFDTEPTKYINVGGSEDSGIHAFKLKYRPIKENSMFWATNYFDQRVDSPKQIYV